MSYGYAMPAVGSTLPPGALMYTTREARPAYGWNPIRWLFDRPTHWEVTFSFSTMSQAADAWHIILDGCTNETPSEYSELDLMIQRTKLAYRIKQMSRGIVRQKRTFSVYEEREWKDVNRRYDELSEQLTLMDDFNA